MGYEERLRRQRARVGVENRELSQLWPPVVEPRTLTQQVYDESSAESIPAVGKALGTLQLAATMPLACYRGDKPLATRPRLLEQPDLTAPGSTWFVQQHVRDWYLAGNALHLVTVRDVVTGWPAAVRYYPARQWHVELTADGFVADYYLNGHRVPTEDVVHVRRGQHPRAHGLGIGIVEQYLATLDRAKLEEESERQTIKNGAVPSAAIITPQKEPSQTAIDKAADAWMQKMSGPGRQPVILPSGTQVVPLGWSASDQQMIEARKMSLIDIGNLSNMDPYWLGAPGSSHTYRSPGPLWLMLIRQTLEPVVQPFEDAWSLAWLPRGRRVVFDRPSLSRDDLASEITAMKEAVGAGLFTWEEARVRLSMDPTVNRPGANEDARGIAEMVQKIYLGVGKVITAEEAREVLNKVGAGLSVTLPPGLGVAQNPTASAVPDGEVNQDEPAGDGQGGNE